MVSFDLSCEYDEDGNIKWARIYNIHQLPDIEEVIEQLK